MRTTLFMLLIFCTSLNSFSQSKKELEKQVFSLNNEIINLKNQLLVLKEELYTIKVENDKLRSNSSHQLTSPNDSQSLGVSNNSNANNDTNLVGDGRCQAITNAGKQCSRKADSGSKYCWQHKSTYEPSTNQQKSTSNGLQNSKSTNSGRTIYTGSRGGKYYINSKGNKTYIKKN